MLDDEYKKKMLDGLQDKILSFDFGQLEKALDSTISKISNYSQRDIELAAYLAKQGIGVGDKFTMNDYRPPTPRSTYVLESGEELKNVHSKTTCTGQACAIHHPSAHALSSKPRVWRNNLIYRICDHEVEHPDFDSLASRLESTGSVYNEHLCCLSKCCGIPELVDIVG